MSKLRVGTIVIGAILALAATAFAQSPPAAGQPAMQGQQAQPPSMPGQQAQPAAPGQQDRSAPQNAPSAAASPADAVAKQLAQLLNLSDTQTTQVRDVLQDEHTKLLALRDDTTMAPQDKQAKLMDIRRTASDKVMAILTPAQQKKLADAIQTQHQQSQQPGAPPQRPPQ